MRELDIHTHRRMESFHSLPEYILREDDVSKILRSEIIQELHDQKQYILDAYDINYDVPCSSKQLQVYLTSIFNENILRLSKYSGL